MTRVAGAVFFSTGPDRAGLRWIARGRERGEAVFERLSDEAQDVVTDAIELARRCGASHVGTEHLLVAAVRLVAPDGDGPDVHLLEEALRERGAGEANSSHVPFSPRAKEILEDALARALASGSRVVRVQEIWRACLTRPDSGARTMLDDLGVRVDVHPQDTANANEGREAHGTADR